MKVLVLGGGISGLSAAWALSRKFPNAQITLLEKSSRLGGVIETKREGEFLYELGPRTFAFHRSKSLLQLIQEVGLEKELIFSKGGKRYLYQQGRLQTIPIFSLLPRLLFCRKSDQEDESIYEFAKRNFNRKIAETLFDPLTLGIYAGDIRKLSMRSCFPKFWEGAFFSGMKTGGLFTLRRGMGSLIEELQKQLPVEFVFNTTVESIGAQFVAANGKIWEADQIVSTLPAAAIGSLLGEHFTTQSLWVVNLLFKEKVLKKKGYGYLIPTREKEALLGMVWDSSIFPELNQGTVLTALIRPETEDPIAAALDAIRRHLRIDAIPETRSYFASNAIPQFEVGYWQKIAQFEERHQSLILLGNYFQSPSVDTCIHRSLSRLSVL